jgi:signal transduction histidine kinase
MKQEKLGIDILPVFRLYIGIYLAFSILAYIAGLLFSSTPRLHISQPVELAAIVINVLLLAYLCWPTLQRRLGRLYLPVALAVTTLVPLLSYVFFFNLRAEDETLVLRETAFQWQLTMILFVPLILISWIYSYRVVVAYSLILAGVSTIFLFVPLAKPSQPRVGVLAVVLFRTAIYLFIGYIVQRLVSQQRRQTQALEKMNQQLANSAVVREQLAISHERNRLARELHDTLAHSLSAVAVQLEAVSALWDAKPEQARAMLDQSLRQTRSGLGEARQAILALRATPLSDLGLPLALRTMAISMAERGDFAVSLDLPEDDSANFAPEVEHSIYRISEEAFRNISHHAQAKNASITLKQEGGSFQLKIQDDGTGMVNDLPARKGHFGLYGMREWADTIGATLKIESAPGQGTIVCMEYQEQDGSSSDL